MRRSLTIVSGILIFFLFVATGTSSAQTGTGDCSKPLPDPITHIPLKDALSVTTTKDGCWIFIGTESAPPKIEVFQRGTDSVRHIRTVTLEGKPRALSLTHDEETLVVGAGSSLSFLDVA